MNGLLNINKSSGMTSHDVVDAVRHLVHTRRVGHTGTLDPLATGVLVIMIGAATRLARFFSGMDKGYRAVVKLGETTTTYDAEGICIDRQPVTATQAEVEAALASFRGPQLQVPPMYSAIRVDGRRLYKLAYQGKEIEREARPITIHALAMTRWEPPTLTLEITCSAGTYIRSLAHDLGQILGCGAHLAALTRTAAGPFTLETSHTLEALNDLAQANHLEDALLSPGVLLPMPAAILTLEQVQAIRHGKTITLTSAPVPELQAWDAEGNLVAILIPLEERQWRPSMVLTEA
ncbi:MAG: tRNA pseudouridine(55) synthase TruB [Anaerolineae bacterium]|jgi:tRNA pseudouridine55 synthase|nr:tRNA pseudouridine(55) synthase TruB [Anaerolineae bacterium]